MSDKEILEPVKCCECGTHDRLYFTKWKATVCKECYQSFYRGE